MAIDRLMIPETYLSKLTVMETEIAIKLVKDTFEHELAKALNLTRVSAPLFVRPETGLNDDLNGVERPVQFDILDLGADVQIVQSLAKWKRMALKAYGFEPGTGLYTDMNAIRRDEDLDNLHSVYVDQWDWERVITKEERNLEFLKSVVMGIFESLKKTQDVVCGKFPQISRNIPQEITFITTSELEERYPDLTSKEREDAISKECGIVFLMQIGGVLKSGKSHDGRAPDYDDWQLNGDIIVWNPTLNRSLEISSMGIRVDEEAMRRQLQIAGCEGRSKMPFHKALLEGKLPLTIGGGIGQSRICMMFLEKAHIGEVQSSVWPEDMIDKCEENGIHLL